MAIDFSSAVALNVLDIPGRVFDALKDFTVGSETSIVGAVYESEPGPPQLGYYLPFVDASECLSWLRWWVLPCEENPGDEFSPRGVVLTGAREVLATAIDHAIVQVGPTATLLGVREMLCGPFAQSSSAGSAPLPGAADMESPLDEICIPAICTASELLLRLNGAPDKLARWLREPVAVHDGTIALSGRAWQKVNRAVWDALCGGDGSLDSVVCALSRRLRNARDR